MAAHLCNAKRFTTLGQQPSGTGYAILSNLMAIFAILNNKY